MANFNFTSTLTDCTITGVKDKTVTQIIVPDYVTSIDKSAFYGCDNLEELTLPFVGANADTDNSLGYLFGATSLQDNSLYVPSSLKKVTVTGGTSITSFAFSHCENLTSIVIGSDVTNIGDYVFVNCYSLTNIEVSEDNIAFKSIDGNLYSKDGKTLVQYAIGKTHNEFSIPDGVTTINGRAFYGCKNLPNVKSQIA